MAPAVHQSLFKLPFALLLAACFFAFPACKKASNETPSITRLEFATEDGVDLVGTLYRPSSKDPPGLVLLHGVGHERNVWSDFARKARAAGYQSLAFDFRGHGESGVPKHVTGDFRMFDDAEWDSLEFDLEAALRQLINSGADPDNIAIVGADLGGSVALLYDTTGKNSQALVMISPGLRYKNFAIETPMRETLKSPVLLIATEGDSYSAESARRLKEIAPGFCELQSYPGSAHGTDILISSPQSIHQILIWLDGTVGAGLAP